MKSELAFTTPFTGLKLRSPYASNVDTLRCSMAADSVAPLIQVKDTHSDQTSRISISWDAIPPNMTGAVAVTGNASLAATLKARAVVAPPCTTEPVPSGKAAADFYFPQESRNEAPVITLGDDHSLSVDIQLINTVVAGASSNEVDSPAFWKRKEYKWKAPDTTPSTSVPESLSTEKYEKYFPSDIRNMAPCISMKPPAGDWDKTAYLIVGTEFVPFNTDIARRLTVSFPEDEPSVKGAAAISRYYSDDHIYQAPVIKIDNDYSGYSMSWQMEKIEENMVEAEIVMSQAKAHERLRDDAK